MSDNRTNGKEKPLRWFRLYSDAVDDPKVQKLPAHIFKVWINLLCLAAKNKGRLPARDDLAFALRMSDHDAAAALDHLIDAGLMDIVQGGIEPHNWAQRQFRSDADPTAAERQKRRREKLVTRDITDVSRTPEQSRAESEQNTDQKTEQICEQPLAVVVPMRKAPKNGSRLDPDWQLPDDWMTWARVNCPAATVEQIQDQAAQFRDYWIAKPGAQACKLDWEATWRNWCRRGLSEAGMRRPQSTGAYHAKPKLDWDEVMREATKLAEGYA